MADIPGLKSAEGLRIVNGNRTTYLRLLTLFVEQYGNPAFLIRDLLGQGDRAAIRRFSHDLSASPGSVGATPVQQRPRL
ncbi:Hpt domain-containing protein [Methylotetracoccus oryzae]|uniref:Hpt domain-containing protein n=1 Tax=Methylotetracoccus oryzae TaxID=1919059 RepID=UPI001117D4FA|nr:Hpt domain-containing protein [Methylotetracoccus oryzae]